VATKDFRDSVEPAIRPFLSGDEPLLAASPLVADPGATEDVDLADELKNLLDPTLYVGLGAHPGNALQQATWGKGVVGGPESAAGKLFAVIGKATSPTVAVAQSGLYIFDMDTKPRGEGFFAKWFGEVDRVANLLHRVPRETLMGAVATPKGVLRQGRLLAGFTDGSGCALVCAPPSLAPAVVAAIGAPKS
jgi:hypothetical protein